MLQQVAGQKPPHDRVSWAYFRWRKILNETYGTYFEPDLHAKIKRAIQDEGRVP